MNENNVQDVTFVEVENLVDDTQLSAEAVCACGDPDGMGFSLLSLVRGDAPVK